MGSGFLGRGAALVGACQCQGGHLAVVRELLGLTRHRAMPAETREDHMPIFTGDADLSSHSLQQFR